MKNSMRIAVSVLSACLIMSAANAAEIIEITEDNMNETFAQKDPLMVMFYAPWCGKCRKMEPEFHKAVNQSEAEGLPFSFGRIHADNQADLTASLHVSSFPAFITYVNESISRLPVLGSGEALLTYLRQADGRDPGSSAKPLSTLDEAGEWLFWRGTDKSKLETTLVGFFPPEIEETKSGKQVKEVFDQVSRELLMYLRFAEIRNTELINTFNMPVDTASIALYKDFDEGKNVYGGNADADELKDWIQRLSTPLVTTVDHWELRSFQRRGNALVHVFVPESTVEDGPALLRVQEETRKAVAPLEDEGVFTRGQMTFAITNGEKYVEWLKPFSLLRDRLPAFGLVNLNGGDPDKFEFYGFQVTGEESKELISQRQEQTPAGSEYIVEDVDIPTKRLQTFVRDFVQGKLKKVEENAIAYDSFGT